MKKQPLTSLNTQLGPGAEYVNTYTKLIKEQGYAHVSVQDQIRLITRFIGWLRRMHTEIGSLDETIVHRFLRHRKNLGCTRHGDAAALDRFLHMLRGQGVAPHKKQLPLSPREKLIANYERYLFQERGLARGTVIYYVAMVDEFLSTRFRQRPLNLSQLGAPDVTGFVRQRAHKLGPQCAQLLSGYLPLAALLRSETIAQIALTTRHGRPECSILRDILE
jgi:integrase/recombinase XerD